MGCYLARPITDKEIENVEKKGMSQKFVLRKNESPVVTTVTTQVAFLRFP